MMNDGIKVDGTTAIYPQEGQRKDFSAYLSAISPLLHQRSTLIAIEGHSGTGKSGLAQVLKINHFGFAFIEKETHHEHA